METNIRIKIIDNDGIYVKCSQGGKKVDMNNSTSIANVAGVLAQVCCEMIKHNNKLKSKEK